MITRQPKPRCRACGREFRSSESLAEHFKSKPGCREQLQDDFGLGHSITICQPPVFDAPQSGRIPYIGKAPRG